MSLACEIKMHECPGTRARWPVKMQTSVGDIHGVIEYISATGAHIICDKPVPGNDLFTMAIEVPDRLPLEIGAEVVWIEIHLTSDRESTPVNMEVRFIDIYPDDSQFLFDLLLDQSKNYPEKSPKKKI